MGHAATIIGVLFFGTPISLQFLFSNRPNHRHYVYIVSMTFLFGVIAISPFFFYRTIRTNPIIVEESAMFSSISAKPSDTRLGVTLHSSWHVFQRDQEQTAWLCP